MAINPDDLRRRLREQLCASVRVERRPDGELMLQADFEFPDGDRYPIYLSEAPGGVRLSDRGDTLMRISYDRDIDAFLAGSRGQLIERILGEERVAQDRGVFHLDAPIDRLSDALFRYGRALTRIYDLTLHSRSRATSTFYEDLADLLFQTVDEERIQRDHLLPDLPNAEAYPIDYPPRLRFDPGFQRSGRHPAHGPGEAVGCGRGHGVVAGVAGGLPAEGGEAGWVGTG